MFRASWKNTALAIAGCAALLATNASAGSERGGTTIALSLLNGWKNAPLGTANAGAESINNIVHLKGAISKKGANAEPFVVPAPYRPASHVHIPISACNATNAQLEILPGGDTAITTDGKFSDSSCEISLDSVTFPLSSDGSKPLKLLHGWMPLDADTAVPAVQIVDGMVHFEGAIRSRKKNNAPFVVPKGFRPNETVYVKVVLCDAANGRLEIDTNGKVFIQAEKQFNKAGCMTSLDGVSYAPDTGGYIDLSLTNGWTNFFGDRPAAVHMVNGVVQLEGAITTTGTNGTAFTLPSDYRPSVKVFAPASLCAGANGRLEIDPDGTVTVTAEGDFANAQCFTSLEGITFVR